MTLTWRFGSNSALKPLWWLDQVDFTVSQYRHLTTCHDVLPNEVHLYSASLSVQGNKLNFSFFHVENLQLVEHAATFEHPVLNRADKPENNTFVISRWNWCLWNHNNDALRLSARLFLTGILQELHNSVSDQWGSSANGRWSRQNLCCAWVSLSGG